MQNFREGVLVFMFAISLPPVHQTNTTNIYLYIVKAFVAEGCQGAKRDDMTPAWVVPLLGTLLAYANVATGNSSFDCSKRRLRPSISIGGPSLFPVNSKSLKLLFAAVVVVVVVVVAASAAAVAVFAAVASIASFYCRCCWW